MKLKYTGDGVNLINIPSRDLDENEIEALAKSAKLPVSDYIKALTARGVFSVIKPPRKPKPKPDSQEEVTE